jgi:site-specific DNA-methyltransferase (adenine-specific)
MTIDLTQRWQVIHGESLDVLRSLPDGCVDAVVTDPPYSSGGQFRGDRNQSTDKKYQSSGLESYFPTFSGDNRDQRSFLLWCAIWLEQARRASRDGAFLAMFSDWRQLPTATDAVQVGGWVWRGIVPWDKVNARPQPNSFRAQAEYVIHGTNGGRDYSTDGASYHDGVIRVQTPPTAEREHSTQKPVALMQKVVEVGAGKNRNALILDPFCGSGSTGVAAVQMGYRFLGIEREAAYVAIARRRIADAAAQGSLFDALDERRAAE